MKNSIIIIIFITGCSFHPRPWTSTEKTMMFASFGAAYADYQTTHDLLNRNGHENNPIMGKHPSDEKLVTYMLTSQIIATVLAHYFPKYRKALLGGKTILNGSLAIHNSQE